jgi:hypothetical protein
VLALVAASSAGSAPAGDKAGLDRAPQAEAKARALVRLLGSPEFAERQAAQQKLQELGSKALPAVTAGRKHADLEIALRCKRLFLALRADWLKQLQADLRADKAGRRDHDHPIWQRFKKIAGDDRASRELLSRMLLDDRRARLLDAAEVAPEKAAELYQQEVERLAENSQWAVGMILL